MKEKVVFPGDEVAYAEELLPGDGTYADGKHIRASILGKLLIDERERKAVVSPLTPHPQGLKNGDVILGEVRDVRPDMVFLKVVCNVEMPERDIPEDVEGILRVSQIAERYVKDASTEFRVNDIARAKVISDPPSLQLTTKRKDLGVIKAYCSRCRSPLIRKGNGLYCEECDRSERRKLADDYGSGKLSVEAFQEEQSGNKSNLKE
jgi:exosome complex component CSL4